MSQSSLFSIRYICQLFCHGNVEIKNALLWKGSSVKIACLSSHPLITVNVQLSHDNWEKEGFPVEAVPHRGEAQLQESRGKGQDQREWGPCLRTVTWQINQTRTGNHILSGGRQATRNLPFGSSCCFLYHVDSETNTWESASNTQGLTFSRASFVWKWLLAYLLCLTFVKAY